MSYEIYDLLVIGGGINGAGIAADAAMRGLRVFLAEANDLGGATSSASSKLIHGGLRYLEHFEFRLVREALAEREVLLAKAQHIIRPLQFILPHVAGMRSRVLMRTGLYLYDHLAARVMLGGSRSIDLRSDPGGAPLKPELENGFRYWDCAVDDARLVIENAIAASEAGAHVMTRTAVRGLRVEDCFWIATLGDDAEHIAARAVVNAAGPWVGDVARLLPSHAQTAGLRLIKGSHIVVPRIAGADDAYTLQNLDGRVVFAVPFETDFTLIGTTEQPKTQNLCVPTVTREEESYLLDAANRYFRVPLMREDIVWRFAGVRPLDDDGNSKASAVTRDYRLVVEADETPPMLHVIGGKITTYRRLSEAALDRLAIYFPDMRACSTATAPLPGGNFDGFTFHDWFNEFVKGYPLFQRDTLLRLVHRYGTRTPRVISGASSEADLGEDFGGGLSGCEVSYLKSEEWAETADDVLWRRTKTGLHIAPGERASAAEAIQRYLDRQ